MFFSKGDIQNNLSSNKELNLKDIAWIINILKFTNPEMSDSYQSFFDEKLLYGYVPNTYLDKTLFII